MADVTLGRLVCLQEKESPCLSSYTALKDIINDYINFLLETDVNKIKTLLISWRINNANICEIPEQ